MKSATRILLLGGIALALLGMAHGLWYAAFAEHQALDSIGGSLTNAFTAAATRNPVASHAALDQYRLAKYNYERQVDVHGHWLGLAMLLIVLAIGFERVAFAEKTRLLLAVSLLLGSVLFPLGVLLQTFSHATFPRAIAALGAALVIAALAAVTMGFIRRRPAGLPA